MLPAAGDRFPDLTLPDHAGRERPLSELAAGDPLVLQTFRGFWCPKEQTFFRRLLALQDEAEVGYTAIVSLSVDPPIVNAALRAGLGARWTFLSDEQRRWLDELQLRETADTTHDPYLPAVFVLAPDLTVHSAYNGYWYWGRPRTDELCGDLAAVTQVIRSDWDPPR